MALLKFKRSATPSKVPTTSDLALGELALNTYDGKVYMKKDDGTQAIVEVGGTSGGGTVTSVDVSGGTTGLTFSGGPVTSSGTITQGGTLNVANGGTGATSLTSGYVLKGNGTSPVSASVIYDDGTNVGIGTTSPSDKLTVESSTTTGISIVRAGSTRLKATGDGTLAWGASADYAALTWDTGRAIIQSTAGKDLAFNTNGSNERLRITSAGDVGIGTSSPGARLHVSSGSASTALFLQNTTGGTGRTWKLDSFQDGNMYVGVPGVVDSMTFAPSGNVGIGTSSPATRAHLVGNNVAFRGQLSLQTASAQNIAQMTFYDQTTLGAQIYQLYTAAAGVGEWAFVNSGTAATTFWTSNTERMRIDSSGSVTANVDMRAPIFYDSNNTAYYVDPANTGFTMVGGTSSRVSFYTADSGYMVGNAEGSGATVRLGAAWGLPGSYSNSSYTVGAESDIQFVISGTTKALIDSGANLSLGVSGFGSGVTRSLYIGDTNGGISSTFGSPTKVFGFHGVTFAAQGTTLGTFASSGILNVTTGVSAPVFTDSANSAYYVDPASTGTSLLVAGGAYAAGQIRATGWWGSASGSATGLGVEIGQSGGRSYILSYNRDIANYGPMSFEATNFNFTGVSGGYAQIDTSFRAPIFYDSDNTAYYVDLTGSTSLNAAGSLIASGNITLNNGANRRVRLGSATNYYYDVQSTGNDFQIIEAGTTPRLTISYPSGAVTAATDFRAPVFYDSDNTAYYVDPNSNSVLNTLYFRNSSGGQSKFAYGSIFGYSSSYKTVVLGNEYLTTISMGVDVSGNASGSFNGGGEGREVIFRNGVNFITPNSANNSYLNPLNMTDGYVTSSGSFRAPIFYDSDNTAYYVDGNNTSVLWEAATYYLRNIADVSVDHPYGLYFSNNRSSAYAIFRESGGWTHPYPDLRIAFHTGIKIGANAGYGGVKFYTDYDMATQVMSVNNGSDPLGASNVYVNNSLQAGSSLRAPIFYDSNDGAYYVNPNGTSNLNAANGMWMVGTTNAADIVDGSTWYGLGRNNVDGWNAGAKMVQLAGYFGIRLRTASYNLDVQGSSGIPFSFSGYGQFAGSVRAPVFYDSDNTAYFIDGASESSLNTLRTAGAVVVGGNFSNNAYNSTTGARLFFGGADADAQVNYYIGTNIENYGGSYNKLDIRWHTGIRMGAQPGYGGIRFYDTEDLGTQVFAIAKDGNYAQANQSMRAPIFYDLDNTAYYADPASESVLNTVTFFGELNLSATGQTYVDHTGTIIFRNQSGYATSATLTTSGNFTATGNVTAYSDIRVKDNVKQIEGALDKVQAIRGVTYNRTDLEDTERRYGGVIAQEIEKVLPEAIFENDDRKAVDYNATIGLLIEAIKELKAEVETLKKG